MSLKSSFCSFSNPLRLIDTSQPQQGGQYDQYQGHYAGAQYGEQEQGYSGQYEGQQEQGYTAPYGAPPASYQGYNRQGSVGYAPAQQYYPPSQSFPHASSPPVGTSPGPSIEQQFGQFGQQLGAAFSNPLAQAGVGYAAQFVSQVNDSFISRWTGSLRYYFSVSNNYVLNKLKILLFPFVHKSWSRRIVPAADGREMYLPPNQDVNAPDLYIPTMAFVTYILLITLIMATSSTGFKPDVLGVTASSGLITLALEVFIVKLGFYLLSYPPVLILDLVAYCGYKFVGIIFILCASWVFGTLGFIAAFVVFALFMAIFMVKTLRLIVPQPLEATPRNVRNYALISIAILQGLFTGILCWMDARQSTSALPTSTMH